MTDAPQSTDLVPAKAGKVGMTSFGSGGALPALQSLSDVLTIATLMSRSGQAVPMHLRNNEGASFAVTLQALDWGANPFAVANKTYMVNDRIAYEAQMISAVINARAPIKGRPIYVYDGEGPTRRCTVTVTTTDDQVLTYTSPMFKDIKVKNSPQWTADVDQQFAYYSIRSLSRRYFPEIILGIYDREEMSEESPPEQVPGAPSGIKDQLKAGADTGGFSLNDIETAVAQDPVSGVVDAEFEEGAPQAVEPAPDLAERQAVREGEPTQGEVYILAAEVAAGGKVQTYKDGEKYSNITIKGQGKYAVYEGHAKPPTDQDTPIDGLVEGPISGESGDLLAGGAESAAEEEVQPPPAEDASAPPTDPQEAEEPAIRTNPEDREEDDAPLTPLGRMKLATTWARTVAGDPDGILNIYGEIAVSPEFKAADPEDQDDIRAAAWTEVLRINRDHGAKVDQALDVSAFALWFVTQTGQEGVDAIEGTYRSLKRTPRYEKQSDAFKAGLESRVQAYIERISGQ